MAPSLATTVAGVSLPTCVYNASGPRSGTGLALSKVASSEAGAVLAKSATCEAQTGNPQPRIWHAEGGGGDGPSPASLNSEGLPNSGIEYYVGPDTVSEALGGAEGKPYMVSISGHNLADNLRMLERIAEARQADPRIAGVELNLACPNVIGKPIIAYDFEQMAMVLDAVAGLKAYRTIPLGVKMPPYFDGPHFERAAEVLNRHRGVVNYVASINTVGNAFAVDAAAEMPVIGPKGGFAGLSGRAVKHTALANVRTMRKLLHSDIDVVGVGGIQSGADAFEMILCGAVAVQVGTCHWTEGPKCFDRICSELRSIMAEKGYRTVDDFRGKLRPWSKEGAAVARKARAKARAGGTTGGGGTATARRAGSDPYAILSAVLAVLVAVLMADKLGVVAI